MGKNNKINISILLISSVCVFIQTFVIAAQKLLEENYTFGFAMATALLNSVSACLQSVQIGLLRAKASSSPRGSLVSSPQGSTALAPPNPTPN